MTAHNPVRVALVVGALLAAAGCEVQPVVYAPVPARSTLIVVEAPPPLPIYEQPPCPIDGYHWMPGYWARGGAGYFWVPGTWVMPPRVGVVWTPGYWAFAGEGRYLFHDGYWGASVGFYGGINYGGGYIGTGFIGGRWEGSAYRYNAEVTNVTNVRNVYRQTVVNNVSVNNITVNNTTRVSYSGGQGGTRSQPTDDERSAERQPHLAATDLQRHHQQEASANPALLADHNQGRPPIAATPRPGAFTAPQATAARAPTQPEAEARAPLARPEPAPAPEPAHVQQRAAETQRPAPQAERPAARERPTAPPKPKHKPKPKPKHDDRDAREGHD